MNENTTTSNTEIPMEHEHNTCESLQEVCDILEDEGWSVYGNYNERLSVSERRNCYKRLDTPTRCRCNSYKPGIQACISVTSLDGLVTYEISLSGELPDGTWIALKQWCLPARIRDGLLLIPRLLSTWEHISSEGE